MGDNLRQRDYGTGVDATPNVIYETKLDAKLHEANGNIPEEESKEPVKLKRQVSLSFKLH